jgi:hypothetical protein
MVFRYLMICGLWILVLLLIYLKSYVFHSLDLALDQLEQNTG